MQSPREKNTKCKGSDVEQIWNIPKIARTEVEMSK